MVVLNTRGKEAELKFQTPDECELVRNLLPYSGSDLISERIVWYELSKENFRNNFHVLWIIRIIQMNDIQGHFRNSILYE